MTLDRHDLASVSRDLLGPRWRRVLARELGPHHPRGPRETIDPRLVSRWALGQRPIPEWVTPAMKIIAKQRIDAMQALVDRIGPVREDC